MLAYVSRPASVGAMHLWNHSRSCMYSLHQTSSRYEPLGRRMNTDDARYSQRVPNKVICISNVKNVGIFYRISYELIK